MKKFLAVIASAMLFSILSGCTTPVRFREDAPLGRSDASRVTISAAKEKNAFGIAYQPGKVYINGVFYGDFSNEQPVFSVELPPGDKLIVVCPGENYACINAQINLAPNKHYSLQYKLETNYLVITVGYVWKLVTLSVEDYYPKPSTRQQVETTTQRQKSENNSANTMDSAKKKCVELGFKTNTQSFGECILKLSK